MTFLSINQRVWHQKIKTEKQVFCLKNPKNVLQNKKDTIIFEERLVQRKEKMYPMRF